MSQCVICRWVFGGIGLVCSGLLSLVGFGGGVEALGAEEKEALKKVTSVHEMVVKNIKHEDVALSTYRGRVMLIVNVASKCGYTKQYKGLEALYKKYESKGLAILGFPCNQFLAQEPGDEAAILKFCQKNYGVTFDLFEKISVKGAEALPLYRYLTSDVVAIDDQGPVKWNFEKFLVDQTGRVIKRYRSKIKPAQIEADIQSLLKGLDN